MTILEVKDLRTHFISRDIDNRVRVAESLLAGLVTQAAPKSREVEAARARERAAKRFGARA